MNLIEKKGCDYMKKILLAIVEVLLLTGICTAAGWDYSRPMPQMPTPGMSLPTVQYQPGYSQFGYPAPYYCAPAASPAYAKPFDNYAPRPALYPYLYPCNGYGYRY